MEIVVASPICPEALARLQCRHQVVSAWELSPEALQASLGACEILIFRSGVTVSAELMGAAPALQLLIRAGSGLDNLDLAYAEARGIALVRIATPGARAVAELTFGLMIMLAREILWADSALRRGAWLKHHLTGHLLKDKTLGLVGAGNIGTMVGELAGSWGMQVLGCVARPDAAAAARLERAQIRLTDFREVVAAADFLSLHVPLDPTTQGLIGAENLARMKGGAFLINMARGGVVDEQALYRALLSPGGLAGAALDVHVQEGEGCHSPLAALPNVVLTPHIGATTIDSQREIGREIVAAVENFAQSRSIATEPAKGWCDGQQITAA